jgi:hypothetical protein
VSGAVCGGTGEMHRVRDRGRFGQGYLCTVCSSSRPYARGSFDFLAAYLIYEDAWYIIPEEEILGKKSISLSTNCIEARYEQYREAWNLLQPDSDSTADTIDIKACAEDFSSAWFDEEYLGGSLIETGSFN